jgi:hypothetical protein
MKKIEVVIGKTGSTRIEASGYTGGSCQQATEGLRRTLAGVNGEEITEMKAEAMIFGNAEEDQHLHN